MSGAGVYRAFDDRGLLLYVGCTGDLARRLAQHRAASIWHQFMDHVEMDWHDDRDDALAAEAAAIRTERPFFNAQPEHTTLVQANRNEATRLLNSLGIRALDDDEASARAWYDARNAIGVLIRRDFPVVGDEERLMAYRAARGSEVAA